MASELQIKNVSQTKGLDLSLTSIQTKDSIKISIPPNDSARTKILKEGVRNMRVSILGETQNFWEGIVPVNILDSLLINPDDKSVSYKDNTLVNVIESSDSTNIYIILAVISIVLVTCFWLYKRK
jgi:hypothetical protein